MFAFGGAAMVSAMGCGLTLIHLDGVPSRFSDRVYLFDEVGAQDLRNHLITPPTELVGDGVQDIALLGANDGIGAELLVWGDSHARSILPSLVAAAESQGAGVYAAWHSATPPVMNYIVAPRHKASLGNRAPIWAEAIVREINKREVKKVLLVARWSEYFSDDIQYKVGEKTSTDTIKSSLLRTVRDLTQDGVKVWVLREVPSHEVAVPKVLMMSEILGIEPSRFACDRAALEQLNKSFDALSPQIIEAGGRIVDVSGELLGDDGEHFRMSLNGVPLYYDRHHLTQGGARLLAPVFESMFQD